MVLPLNTICMVIFLEVVQVQQTRTDCRLEGDSTASGLVLVVVGPVYYVLVSGVIMFSTQHVAGEREGRESLSL